MLGVISKYGSQFNSFASIPQEFAVELLINCYKLLFTYCRFCLLLLMTLISQEFPKYPHSFFANELLIMVIIAAVFNLFFVIV